MRQDARQPQHVEAGPQWYRVRYTFVTPHGGRRPAPVYYAMLRQPITAAKVKRAWRALQPGQPVGVIDTSLDGGLLLGAYKVIGTWAILQPALPTKSAGWRPGKGRTL